MINFIFQNNRLVNLISDAEVLIFPDLLLLEHDMTNGGFHFLRSLSSIKSDPFSASVYEMVKFGRAALRMEAME